jgi:hypothetical protein
MVDLRTQVTTEVQTAVATPVAVVTTMAEIPMRIDG